MPPNSCTENKRSNSSPPLGAVDCGVGKLEPDLCDVPAGVTIAKARDMVARGERPARVRFEDSADSQRDRSAG